MKSGDLVKIKESFGPDLTADSVHAVFVNKKSVGNGMSVDYFILGHEGTKVVFMTERYFEGELKSQKPHDASEMLTVFNKDVILPIGGQNGF